MIHFPLSIFHTAARLAFSIHKKDDIIRLVHKIHPRYIESQVFQELFGRFCYPDDVPQTIFPLQGWCTHTPSLPSPLPLQTPAPRTLDVNGSQFHMSFPYRASNRSIQSVPSMRAQRSANTEHGRYCYVLSHSSGGFLFPPDEISRWHR